MPLRELQYLGQGAYLMDQGLLAERIGPLSAEEYVP